MTKYQYSEAGSAKYCYHVDGTKPINPTDIFVFGSNLAGYHGAGAAKAAMDYYGAEYGVGIGRTGHSYAIPTKDHVIETLPLNEIHTDVNYFLSYAEQNPHLNFFMTRIGCVLAGYNDSDIAPMFKNAPTNINFPESWKQYIED